MLNGAYFLARRNSLCRGRRFDYQKPIILIIIYTFYTADQRVLRWFGERMDDYRMARKVLMAEVSGGRVRGRPRLGWMVGMKVALGNRGMTMEAAWQCAKDRKAREPWYICNWTSFKLPSLLGPLFFRTALPCSGGYHKEREGMPLHNAVGINCKKGSATENQDSGVKYIGSGVYLDCVCVLSDLTWLPLLGVGRKSWYIIYIFSIATYLRNALRR